MWELLGISAAAIWAICNVIDKVVISRYVKDPFLTTIVLGIVGLISAGIVSWLVEINLPFIWILIGCLVAGILYFLGIYLYFVALRFEEVSRVVPVLFLKPIFVLLLATVFLNEFFTAERYMGIFLLVSGSLLSSLKISYGLRISKAFYIMLISALILASSSIITKYLLNFIDYWNVFFWERIGSFLASIPLIFIFSAEFSGLIKKGEKRVWGYMIASEGLNLVALFFVTVALSSGFVSLVSALTATQPLFSLIYALVLGQFIAILAEEKSKKVLALKLSSSLLIIVGCYFIV